MKELPKVYGFLGILLIGAIAAYAAMKTTALGIRPPDDLRIGQMLVALLFVGLVVERALEVFLTTLRAPQSEDMQDAISVLEAEAAKTPTDDQTRAGLETKKRELACYKQVTRRLALFLGLAAGIATSACGFRVLEAVVDASTLPAGSFQLIALKALDVILTGGVIAGGSDGIHKLAEVYRNATESYSLRTAKKA